MTRTPAVALVGRPNVGKSSLFNRLVGGRPAIVEDEPGVTRDRRQGVCSWGALEFTLVDTGGLDPSAGGILGAIRAQTLRAVDEADVLVLVVDGRAGVTPLDAEIAPILRRTGKPVLVAANKLDAAVHEGDHAEFFRLGVGDVLPVSASHGRGVRELLDALAAALAVASAAATADDAAPAVTTAAGGAIRVALVGKPNAGKSSIVNVLLGEERVLVHDQPGTTRDPIEVPFRAAGRDFLLVDTAGLRKRRTFATATDAVAAAMARDQITRAHIAILVIDAAEGASGDDARLASAIEESGRGMVVVMNKMDLVPRARHADAQQATRAALRFLAHVPVLPVSALTRRGVGDIATAAAQVHAAWSRRVPTAELNRHLERIVAERPPPAGPSGQPVRLYFMTQAVTRPPTFFISTSHPKAVGTAYRRFLSHQLRALYGFEGSPLRLVLKERRRVPGGRRRAPAPASGRATRRARRGEAATES